jgi:hypothetical protein
MRKGHCWLPAEKLEAQNCPLRPVRARIEKIFGIWKRSYHFGAMRWMGLAKARLQIPLAASLLTSGAIGGCKARERSSKTGLPRPLPRHHRSAGLAGRD